MPILWIVIYCLIAVAILFALTYHSEVLDEKRRCDGLAKSHHRDEKPAGKDLPRSA